MKKTLLLSLSILSVFFLSTFSEAQVAEQWVAKYSNEGMDQAKSMVLDPFGNIYVAGTSFSSSTGTYWGVLIKYNPAGEQRWAARFNGSTGGANGVAAYTPIVTDASGNVYVTGQSYDATGYYITTIKYDSSGTEQWTAKYSGGAPSAITIDNAGNIYVTGTENVAGHWSDYITIKYDANGVEQWVALYDGPAHYVDDATAIAADNQGNIYVTGYSWVGSNWDYTTVKYNADGIQQWVTNYNGTRSASSSVDIPEAIALAIDMAGNIYIYVTGASEGYGTTIDYLTIKYDATGVMQWDARYNGPGNFFDGATAIAIDKYGNSYVTGYSTAADGSYEFATIKYTSNGGEEWIARYGTGYANAIALDDEGNVYVTGATWGNGSGFLTVKYDNAGTQQWTKSFTGDGYGNDGAVSIAISKNEDCQYIYVTGTSNQNGTEKNISTIKYTEADVLASATAVCIGSGVSFSDNTNHAATGWEWTFQGGTPSSSTEQSPTVTYATAGTYDVTLTSYSATGCRSITKHQYITVNENPIAVITANGPTSFCSGDSVELVSNKANSYLWSNGATTQSIMVTDAGSYTLTTEGGGGCAGTATSAPVTVNIKNQVATITSSGAPVICDTNTLTLTTNIEGASYYWWPTGDTTQSITINSPGDYSLDITDTSGCYSYAFISINGGATPYVFIDAPLTFLCPGGDPVYLSAFTDFNNTIQWSNGAIDPFIMATDVGKYTVTATSPEGCSASDSVTITGLGVPQITASNTVLCDGSTINLTASPNDEANYMYYWSNGETTASININLPDMYWVNVQDIVSGCMASSDPIMINSVPAPYLYIDAPATSICQGGLPVTLSATSDADQYLWSTGETTPYINVSVAGNYNVTVTNLDGCTATSSIDILESNPVATITASGATTFCEGSSVTLTANAADAYLWSNGETTQSITVSASGNYFVTVGDINGCSATSAATTIIVNPLPIASITANGATTFCEGNSVTLTANAANSYLWNNGETTQSISIRTSGNYSVTITGITGCSSSSSISPVNVISQAGSVFNNAIPIVPNTPILDYAICGNEIWFSFIPDYYKTAIFVTNPVNIANIPSAQVKKVSVFGGNNNNTLTLVKAWEIQQGDSLGFLLTDNLIEGNNYYLQVEKYDNLQTTPSYIGVSTQSFKTTDIPCSHDNCSWIIGSNGDFSYSNPSMGGSNPFGSDVVACWKPSHGTPQIGTANSYYATMWNNGGTINPLISGGGEGILATGNFETNKRYVLTYYIRRSTSTGNATSIDNFYVVLANSANSGLPSTTGYNGEPIPNPPSKQIVDHVTNLSSPNWIKKTVCFQPTNPFDQIFFYPQQNIKSETGWIDIDDVNVTLLTYAGADITLSKCNSSVTLGADCSPVSGVIYSWAPSSGLSCTNCANPIATPKITTTYTLTVTLPGICTSTDEVTVTVPVVTISGNTTLCKGDVTTLTASGANSYLWSTGASSEFIIVNPISSTTYTVTGVNNDCLASVSITVNPTPTTNAGDDQVACNAYGNPLFGGMLAANGGTEPYTYSWAPAIGILDPTVGNPEIFRYNGTSTPIITDYTLTVTDANGCSSSDQVRLTINPLPATPIITASGSTTFCENENVTLTSSAANAYLWSTGATTQSITVAASGNYSVTITDANNCSATSATTAVTVKPLPSVSITAPAGAACAGETLNLTGNGADTYSWTFTINGKSYGPINSQALPFQGDPGDYLFTLRGTTNNCTSEITKAITINPLPSLNPIQISPLCNGENTGEITLNVTGGTSPYTYNWSNSATTENINGLIAGTYSVNVTDANGCVQTDNFSISEPSAVTLSTISTDVTCNNGTDGTATVTATVGTGSYTYSWNTTPVQTEATATNLGAGSYTVTVTDANNCTKMANVKINPPSNPLSLNITKYDWHCPYDVGIIIAIPSGGTPPYTYTWSPQKPFSFLSRLPSNLDPGVPHDFEVVHNQGNYTVTVSDANGCSTAQTATILDYYPWITSDKGMMNLFCKGTDITLTANSISSAANYLWSTGETTQSITVNGTGWYSVEVSNTGCSLLPTMSNSIAVNEIDCINTSPDLSSWIGGSLKLPLVACTQYTSPTCTTCLRKQYLVEYYNYGIKTTMPCVLTVTLPIDVKFISASIPPDNPTPNALNQFTWSNLCQGGLDQNPAGIPITIETEISTQTACTPIPTNLTATSEIITANDAGIYPNRYSETQYYDGTPYDPNDKLLIEPKGAGICNTVLATDTFIYQINFQNVGTAPANTVIIVDSIDISNFDITSIKAIQTSHPASFRIMNNQLLIWTFYDINLPDSASNLEGSSGFVKFSIKPKSGIAPSTVINNKASIVFDFNDPVITNTVSNTILGLPVTIAASGATSFCQGDSVVLTANAANSYIWNTGDTTQSITVKASGKYSVIDASKCLANSDSITITVNPLPVANAGVDQTLYLGYGLQSVDLAASTSRGTAPYTYSWNTGAFTQNITVKPVVSTTYEVTVTDANGCSASDAVLVNVIDVRYCKEEKSKGKDNGKGREKEECKIIICHRDKKDAKEGSKNESKGGNNGTGEDAFDATKYQTLIVDKNAVAAHLAHGDYLGSCAIVATKKGEEEIAASAVSTAKTTGIQLENFPNPFSTITTIRFSVPATTPVKLEIYGITGKLLETVFEGTVEENKTYSITYDAKELPTGVYLYRLSSGIEICNKKMLIVR